MEEIGGGAWVVVLLKPVAYQGKVNHVRKLAGHTKGNSIIWSSPIVRLKLNLAQFCKSLLFIW